MRVVVRSAAASIKCRRALFLRPFSAPLGMLRRFMGQSESDTENTPVAVEEHDPYAVLRNRDFAFYLVGRFVASLGQQMLTVAVGWELYERTHSALALGLVGLTQMLPMILFTLPAGHL